VKWWLPVIMLMGVIYLGSSIGNVPRVGGTFIDGLVHRVAHLLEFAALGALLLRAMGKDKSSTRREMMMTLIIVALYGASDEFHQRFTLGRSSEGLTVLFDVAGGALGMWSYRWWIAQRRAHQPAEQVGVGQPKSISDQ
jgi:VanZ family protein